MENQPTIAERPTVITEIEASESTGLAGHGSMLDERSIVSFRTRWSTLSVTYGSFRRLDVSSDEWVTRHSDTDGIPPEQRYSG